MSLTPTQIKESIASVAAMAKEGNQEAIEFLRKHFSLRIYSVQEITTINKYREEGLSLDESISKLNSSKGEQA